MFDKLKNEYTEEDIRDSETNGKYHRREDGHTHESIFSVIYGMFLGFFEAIYSAFEYFLVSPAKWSIDNLVVAPFRWLSRNLVGILVLVAIAYIWFPNIIPDVGEINSALVDILPSFDVQNPFYTPENCSTGLVHNECAMLRPIRCEDGEFVNRSSVCGCPYGQREYEDYCVLDVECEDGTPNPECSIQKPLQCVNGTLIEKASVCGCPEEYMEVGDACEKIKRCDDGTIYGQCSEHKPLYCENGALLNMASLCGCSESLVASGDICVSQFQTNPKTISYPFVLQGSRRSLTFTVYGGLRDYLAAKSRYFECTGGVCPTQAQMKLSGVNDADDRAAIAVIAGEIEKITTNKDDQARIVISFVQNMPYDYAAFNSGYIKGRYPYETLYDGTGVCEEKSKLVASLLRELGFGTVLFEFGTQDHMAVGIKCPAQYDYLDTGYCFVETTTPTIITFSDGDYVGVGKLTSRPEINTVSDGLIFSSAQQEYEDARRYNQIINMGQVLDMGTYNEWLLLSKKYGLKTTADSGLENSVDVVQANPSGIVQTPGTTGVCGHEGETCCNMLIGDSNSATLYEICKDGLRCVDHACIE